ncbi:MAG TPA: hypothetical protein VL947_10960 [Cytophagales bacterium]|nr:hypothetical protein [Cytophagales bacterium]
MPLKSILTRILLSLILVINILNGFLRYHYIVNFYNFHDFIARRNKIKYAYPNSFAAFLSSIVEDPRWLSNVYFMLIAVASTVATVYLLFGRKKALVAFSCYMALFLLCLAFILVTLVTGNYKIGLGIAQEIKNMAQSPIVSFIIIGLFYFAKMDFRSASE